MSTDKYQLKEGVRFIGFQMAQRIVAGFWAHIFVDCTKCDQSIGIICENDEDVDSMKDTDILRIFRHNKWLVEPGKRILCPKCQEENK